MTVWKNGYDIMLLARLCRFFITLHRRGRAIAKTRDGRAEGRLQQEIRSGDTTGPIMFL